MASDTTYMRRVLVPSEGAPRGRRAALAAGHLRRRRRGRRLGVEHIELGLTRVIDAPGVTHLLVACAPEPAGRANRARIRL
jgi:hypothetical protein